MDKDCIIFQEDGLFGAKNQIGDIIIPPQYMEMQPFSCGLSLVRNHQYQYAYIDIHNNLIVPFGKHSWLDPSFVCGFARVMDYDTSHENKVWGVIDTLGNCVIPIEYDKIWPLKEEYLFSVKAFKGEKEELINLHDIQNLNILDGLKYLHVYSVEEFKYLSNCKALYVKVNPKNNQVFFTYGANIGRVATEGIPVNPVVAIVINSNGKVFPLLMEKTDVGKTTFPTIKKVLRKKTSPVRHQHGTTFGDYEAEAMNDVDNWSDPYGDEKEYYGGWSREDVESGLADAFEGDESNYWNID